MTSAEVPSLRRDVLTTALIGVAHGCSHFFQLVLPPLFPFFIAEFDVSYTELGILMTVFFITSGFGQPLAGFLVDRFGARRVMLLGLGIYVIAVLAFSVLPEFWMYFVVIAIAAIGNCVFHPADITILNANVRESHLGRAFSIHTVGGNLGWAIAPGFMLVAAHGLGWRSALVCAAGLGAMVWLVLWTQRHALDHERSTALRSEPQRISQSIAPLLTRPVLLCFAFFILLAAALIAIQNFLPPILGTLHATPLVLAATALTGFLVGGAVGILCGGIMADRSPRHVAIVVSGLLISAVLVMVVAYANMTAAALVATLSMAGFFSGITMPSRDLLVRAAAPEGATGRVFGFVYSGLDVGSAFAPIAVGYLLDHGEPRLALWGVALLLLAAIFTAITIQDVARPRLVVASS